MHFSGQKILLIYFTVQTACIAKVVLVGDLLLKQKIKIYVGESSDVFLEEK